MKKIDKTVLKETKYIAVITFLLSVLMQSVVLIISKWDYTVLCGNLLGYAGAVGNFLLMGITVQNALDKSEKEAADLMKLSQRGRLLLLFVVALLCCLLLPAPPFPTVEIELEQYACTLRGEVGL